MFVKEIAENLGMDSSAILKDLKRSGFPLEKRKAGRSHGYQFCSWVQEDLARNYILRRRALDFDLSSSGKSQA